MTDTSNNHTDEHDDVDAPVEVQTEKVREPTAYEKRLRTANAKERSARVAAEQALKDSKADADKRVNDAMQAAAARIVRAEVKAHAVQAGLVDLDALALIDLSGCTLADDGSVTNAAEAIEKAKKSKPYLFSGATTSSTAPTPKSGPVKEFDARTAGDAEIIAFERKMGIRR